MTKPLILSLRLILFSFLSLACAITRLDNAIAQHSCEDLFEPKTSLAISHPRDRGFSRPWIGRSAFEALDMDAVLRAGSNVSSSRLMYNFLNPLLDASEITQRQQAIHEIQSGLLSSLQAIYRSRESYAWRDVYFANNSYGSWPTIEVHPEIFEAFFLRDPNDVHPSQKREMQQKIAARPLIFSEIPKLEAVISDSTAPRLQELKWILNSVSNPNHPFRLTDWIEQFKQAKTLKAQNTLIQKHFYHWDNLELVMKAYAELAMYFDIAEHATQNGWTTYPEFLEPSSKGPILRISNGHSPRFFRDGADKSIANSINAGAGKARNVIVTGPNGQGKSTYARMLAQLVALAQLGSPVPAARMQLTPLSVLVHVRPTDNPAAKESLFMAEAKTLWKDVLLRARENPYSIVVLDELMPGTTGEIREDTETEFLNLIAATGVISVTNTHNWGTTSLAQDDKSNFTNKHVANYRIRSGRMQNIEAMYHEAATRLVEMGWDKDVADKIERRGKKRVQ